MNLSKAPEQGTMYALYTDRVEYRPYKKEELSEDEIQKHLLELHLFDDTTEYRLIQSDYGEIETVISDESMPHDDIYCEKIYTLKGNEEGLQKETETTAGNGEIRTLKGKDGQPGEPNNCIELVNYLTYDENDLLLIRNYRLKEVR